MKSKLDQLREMTTVVADTGDMEAIRKYRPVDATTNPSLLLSAADNPQYQPLVARALRWSKEAASGDLGAAAEYLAVIAGIEILQLIPGRVSIEVCAEHSYDTQKTIDAARRLIEICDSHGVSSKRILIKIAATWQGIRAAEALERKGGSV